MTLHLKRMVAGSALALALVGGVACDKSGSANETPKPVETAKPAEAPKPAEAGKPDFTVSARDLYAEFRPQIEAGTADAVRAKYTGKTVRISGVVKSNADMLGTWELALAADDQNGQAFLHPTAAALADIKALKAGDNVTMQCVSEGWEIGPQLKDCAIVK